MTPPRGGRSLVRITAGRWKGRRLAVPPGTRPTSERARQALFDALQDSVRGARVLDLYAGSGAVGLEAVSRGAARAVLVEERAVDLERSLERLGATEDEVRLLRAPAERAVRELSRRGEMFDLIFCDPPYALEPPHGVAGRFARLLSPGGVLVLQRDAGAPAPELVGLTLLRRRAYGRNVFQFYAATSSACQVVRPDAL